ncbi:MAG: hydantoinase B/oxoprolinase family protein [Geminicoccaceae bacterium]|nr:MAG: hydantoinase B/oxoprolinase family protein [Geminicoccaceae bacterium]
MVEELPIAPALVDPVEMAVTGERLRALCEDVGELLVRSAVSSNIKERRDCSTGLFDLRGRLVAQADHMPIHIGSLLWGVRALLAKVPPEDLQPGDAFLCNDPYAAGGTHLPDISVLSPVFVDGRPAYLVGNIAHHADVGGPVPGSVSGRSTSIYAEGLRLPLIRLARAGRIDQDLLDLVVLNMREPDDRRHDLLAQLGANAKGAELLQAIVRDTGSATLEAAIDDLLAYTRRRIAMAVAALPDGDYAAERWLDDDGIGDDPVRLAVRVQVRGSALHVDLTGSGPEAQGAVNLSASSLEATLAYCVKALLDPSVPANDGLLQAFTVEAPLGSIVNPRPPAAVAARAVTSNRLAGCVFQALQPALPPHRRMASHNDSTTLVALAGTRPDGTPFVYPESLGGGAGAMHGADGAEGVHVHTVNSTNLPVEVLEAHYPLRCHRHALVTDSGGAGRWRGGRGIERSLEALVDGLTVTLRSDGHRFPAPGLDGGLPGRTTEVLLTRVGSAPEPLPSKTTLTLMRGDRLTLRTLGGGGLGPPSARPASTLAHDLAIGAISEAAARAAYGDALVEAVLGIAQPA